MRELPSDYGTTDSVRTGVMHVGQTVLLLRGGFVTLALGLMLLVPLASVSGPRPAKFGWHMYAAAVHLPDIEVRLSDGSVEERNIANIASGFRSEIDYFLPVARHICGREPNVDAVQMTRSIPQSRVVYECASF